MNPDWKQMVTAEHLGRNAYLYIRQSTLQQVMHNTESTQRQYDLRRRAVSLGWADEQIVVIDTDLGQSGASMRDRLGFQRLVSEVGLGEAGIVLGLEVSRLARNNSDWHRLLEICALTRTLILDEDGVYDPSSFNDRLLLGMKGTMSEAELHLLRARLQGGIRNKARRGELRLPLPVGLSYDLQDKVVLTPDRQVQDALNHFFGEFRRTGSACGVVAAFKNAGLLFPRNLRGEFNRGKIAWGALTHTRALHVLHNPRYAGAFVFGRSRCTLGHDGRVRPRPLPVDQWQIVLPGAHPGYIDWEIYHDNLAILRANSHAHGADRRRHPPGKGPALLQGIVVCGLCGRRMTLRYATIRGKQSPIYICQRQHIEYGTPTCQSIPGGQIDEAIGELLLDLVKPLALELAITVEQEVHAELQATARLRCQAVERLQYAAEAARERFMRVDPRNRLVADQLEADWNDALRQLETAREASEQERRQDAAALDEAARRQIMALAADFPAIWRDPTTCAKDRKRMLRLLIEDVTLTRRAKTVRAQTRLKGGQTHEMTLDIPKSAWEQRTTSPDVIEEIDRLARLMTDRGIAQHLNRRGILPPESTTWTAQKVGMLRRKRKLKSRFDHLRERGLVTVKEMAAELGVTPTTVRIWYRHGLLKGYEYNERGERLYELPPPDQRPKKEQGLHGKLANRRPLASHGQHHVQSA